MEGHGGLSRSIFEFPADALGLDVGAFAEMDLGGHAGMRLEVGYCWGKEKQAEVALREVVNPEDLVRAVDLADVEAALAPAPMRLDPSFFRASLALALRF